MRSLAAAGPEDLGGKAAHMIANPALRAAWRLRMDGADEGELSRAAHADRDAQIVSALLKIM